MGGASNIIGWAPVAVLLLGGFAQIAAIAIVKPERRATLSAFGGVLILTGLFLRHGLRDQPWEVALQLLVTVVVLLIAANSLWRLFQSAKPKPSRDVHA